MNSRKAMLMIAGIFGVFVLLIGLLALFSYASDTLIWMARWGNTRPAMALNTSVALIFTGISDLSFAIALMNGTDKQK